MILWCPGRDLNPHFPFEKTDFKSVASADFATRADSNSIIPNPYFADFPGHSRHANAMVSIWTPTIIAITPGHP